MYGYIYKTTNLINNKIYIGQHKAKQFEPDKYIGSGKIFIKALNKYGRNNFKCELIEECFSKEELDNKEIYWISKLNPHYNLAGGGGGSKGLPAWNKGMKNQYKMPPASEERKRKIGLALRGRKKGPLSESVKAKLRGRHFHLPEYAKIKISLTHKGKKKNYKIKGFEKGHIPWNKGIKCFSEEQKRNLSQKTKNYKTGNIWITNGKECKMLPPEEAKKYPDWYRGRIINDKIKRLSN